MPAPLDMERALIYNKSMKPSPHSHLKFKIAVSGAAETGHCSPDALESAKELGREIVRHKAILVNGATTGFPYWAAIGAKEEGGFTIGLKPSIKHLIYRQM